MSGKGGQALAVTMDVVDEKSVANIVDSVLKVFPHIDILVNAAGIAIRQPTDSFPIDLWRHVMDINTRGTFLACQAVGRVMIKQ